MLQEVYDRYRRPLFVAETGIEDDTRPAWLRYMCKEVFTAMGVGVPVSGVCLYPIVNHPGWDDDRHCYNGLFDYADADGNREPYQPLAEEVARQSANAASFGSAGDLRAPEHGCARHERSGLGRPRHAGAHGREPHLILIPSETLSPMQR